MKRYIIPIDVIDWSAFENEFVANLPSSWDCELIEIGMNLVLEYDMRFEDEVIEALQKAHCRFTFYPEDKQC